MQEDPTSISCADSDGDGVLCMIGGLVVAVTATFSMKVSQVMLMLRDDVK